MPLSSDHKPNRSDEKERIDKAGGSIWCGRLMVPSGVGALAVSRAIGDADYKHDESINALIADPEIYEGTIHDDDEFIILACDGLFDVMSNKQAVDYVRTQLHKNFPIDVLAKEIVDHCIKKLHTTDNVSVIIIQFEK